jgi:hypothetical protein
VFVHKGVLTQALDFEALTKNEQVKSYLGALAEA